jgi:hypothetical protein
VSAAVAAAAAEQADQNTTTTSAIYLFKWTEQVDCVFKRLHFQKGYVSVIIALI